MTTDPNIVDEAALLAAFQSASAQVATGRCTREEGLRLEQALRPGASLREVRDVVVPLLDLAGLPSLAAAWDADEDQLSASRVLARAERWLSLGAPELAADVLSRVHLPGIDLTLLQRRALAALETDLAERAACLQANLVVLREQQPLAAAMIARMERSVVMLRPIGAGVAHRLHGHQVRVLLQATSPAQACDEARAKLVGLSWDAGATCIAGAADGSLLSMALQHGPRSEYGLKARSVIALCDVNAAAVRALLEVMDVREALRARHLRIFAGVDLEAQLLVDFTRPHVARPGAMLGDCHASRDILKRVRDRITVHQHERVLKANQRTTKRAAEIRAAFGSFLREGTPLRIALLSSRVSTYARHGVAASAEALRQLGHDVRVLEAPDEVTAYTGADIAEAIEAQGAQAVFAINYTRGTMSAVARPVAFMTWDMDGCGYVEQSLMRNQIGEHDHVMLAIPHYPPQIGWPRQASHPFPTPFNRAVVDAARELKRDVVAEVAYISNYHSVVEQELDKLRAQCRERIPDVLPVLDALADEAFAHRGPLPMARGHVFGRMLHGVDDPKERLRRHAVARSFQVSVVAPTYRQRHLAAVAESGVDLALYGMGWETHPTLHKFARGLLEGPQELARGYLSAKVQLQIMFGKALHQRLADGAAVGACMALIPHPSDFAGRVRATLQDNGRTKKPAAMTQAQYEHLLDELRSYSMLLEMKPAARVGFGLERLGIATDDVFSPAVLDPLCALGDATLVDKVRELLADDAMRDAAAHALQQEALRNLDPMVLLDRTLRAIARVEAGVPRTDEEAA